MTAQEYKAFCHKAFIQRGFKKIKHTYYLQGNGVLCSLHLEKFYGNTYVVDVAYFIGEYNTPKSYPISINEADVHGRIIKVLSKDTIKGKHFMTSFVEYELYTSDELRPYFDDALDNNVVVPILYGKEELLKRMESNLLIIPMLKDEDEVIAKLNAE